MPPSDPSGAPGLAGLILGAIKGGLSQREAMAQAREAGATFADVRFRGLWHATEELLATRAEMMALPGNRRPPGELFEPWQTRRPGLFSYQVTIPVFDATANETINVQTMVQYDRVVSKNKAEADAIAQLSAGYASDTEQYKGLAPQGAAVTGLFLTVPIVAE